MPAQRMFIIQHKIVIQSIIHIVDCVMLPSTNPLSVTSTKGKIWTETSNRFKCIISVVIGAIRYKSPTFCIIFCWILYHSVHWIEFCDLWRHISGTNHVLDEHLLLLVIFFYFSLLPFQYWKFARYYYL